MAKVTEGDTPNMDEATTEAPAAKYAVKEVRDGYLMYDTETGAEIGFSGSIEGATETVDQMNYQHQARTSSGSQPE